MSLLQPDVSLTLPLILDAYERIRDKINRTPVIASRALNTSADAELFFKCENLQKVGAFKARGATNAVFALPDEDARRGVVTHSSGNHGAALARAARMRGIPAMVVMPNNAPGIKQAMVRRYGGEVISCQPTFESRESTALRIVAETGAVFIHSFNDLAVMAGQGTTALELLEQVPDLDLVLCPVGGGGHLSGIAVAAKSLKADIKVIGVGPSAGDACRSFQVRHIVGGSTADTIADGLRTPLGDRAFAEICRHVDDIIGISESAIIRSMRQLWEDLKMIVEPSGAVAYAAVLEHKLSLAGRRVGIILSGGNVDLDVLPWQQ